MTKKILPMPPRRAPAGTKQAEMLPKNAVLCPQWVRCGKPTCRCARGELHGPYPYLFWREGGRLRKRYVKAADVETVRAACRQSREQEQRERERRQTWHRQWQEVRAMIREVERDGR